MPRPPDETSVLAILGITAPIFILVGIGFLACRSELISREQAAGMGRFVITFALPALVIKALIDQPLKQVLNWNYLCAYGLGSLASFALSYGISRRVRGDSLSGSALAGLGSSVSNSGFVGYPIVVMVVGSPAAWVESRAAAVPREAVVEPWLVAHCYAESARLHGVEDEVVLVPPLETQHAAFAKNFDFALQEGPDSWNYYCRECAECGIESLEVRAAGITTVALNILSVA